MSICTSHINTRFSQSESSPRSMLSPELLWFFGILINRGGAEIAWRKAVYEEKPVNVAAKDESASKPAYPAYNKSKFTGGPAFKELKSIIVGILASQKENA